MVPDAQARPRADPHRHHATAPGAPRPGNTEILSADGLSVEVIDPRSLAPLDKRKILESVARTGRLVVIEPAKKTNGAAAEIAALVSEEMFSSLKAPIRRVTTPDVHIPYSPALEKPLYPNTEKVLAAIRSLVR